MKIKLIEAIRLRSVEYIVGAEIDLKERDAQQLVALGHAAVFVDKPSTTKPPKTPDQE